jgi:hypothetical protein
MLTLGMSSALSAEPKNRSKFTARKSITNMQACFKIRHRDFLEGEIAL